jgi:hypothetical protein
MDVNLHWFNGYYNKSFSNIKSVNAYFNKQIKTDIDFFQCHPLVNSVWCKLLYNAESPLELEFARSKHEWNYLHPLFDPLWYQSKYMDFSESTYTNPYEHFVSIGHKTFNSIHPLVDSNLLMRQNPERGYLDTVTHIGMALMKDNFRSLKKIKLGEISILNLDIDMNYLYPALAWKWI